MYIKRHIDEHLLEWKISPIRKPLLLRGARQVGKSTAVKQLSKQFKYFVEINFDESPQFQKLFDRNLSVQEITEQLSIITNTPMIEGETLLFLDEIQSCIPAITSLRYFYEKKPNLHVIAAGSLLEFALNDIPSFGVGRVRSIFMYPLSFQEFLIASGEDALVQEITRSNAGHPINELLHEKLQTYLKKFLIIGGMPEAVTAYVKHHDVIEVKRILDDLIISLQADFRKYNKRTPSNRIQSVFENIVHQVGSKFKYSGQIPDLNNAQIKQVLELLEMAGLVYTVTHSSCNGIPLGAESNPKKRKYLIIDTGIFQRILGLNITDLFIHDDFEVINKGNIAELFVGLELLKYHSCFERPTLHYWHREEKNSQAELDYVVQKGSSILPIEVKSGKKGSMQSLHLFMHEKSSPKGIRCSNENFGSIQNIDIFPLYAVRNILES